MLRNLTQEQINYLKLLEENPDLINQFNFISQNGLDKTSKLITKFSNLVPAGTTEKADYLYDLLKYVETMIHGDEISQFSSSGVIRDYAKTALTNLMAEVHSQELEKYKSEKKSLCDDISKLQSQKGDLESITDDLTQKISTLSENYNSLSASIQQLSLQQEELIQNGKKEALMQVQQEKADALKQVKEEKESALSKAQSEIDETNKKLDKIRKEYTELLHQADEAKKTLESYSSDLTSIFSPSTIVTWEKIADDDPIYNTNYKTISSYILSLKTTYMKKTGVSKDECDSIFEENCPGLHEFVELLQDFSNDSISATSSLRNIFANDNWSSSAEHKAALLYSTLQNFKMPHFIEKGALRLDELCANSSYSSSNIQQLLANFYWQRKAAEAMAAQKIAEAELQAVVMLFKNAIPQDYNFSISPDAKSAINNREVLAYLSNVQQQLQEPDYNKPPISPIENDLNNGVDR